MLLNQAVKWKQSVSAPARFKTHTPNQFDTDLKTGPDLPVAWADHPLRLGAAGAETTDGFSAGEPGQGEGDAEDEPGQRGDPGGPGGAGAGLPGDPERGSALRGRGRQADRAAGDAGAGEAQGQVLEAVRWGHGGIQTTRGRRILETFVDV